MRLAVPLECDTAFIGRVTRATGARQGTQYRLAAGIHREARGGAHFTKHADLARMMFNETDNHFRFQRPLRQAGSDCLLDLQRGFPSRLDVAGPGHGDQPVLPNLLRRQLYIVAGP